MAVPYARSTFAFGVVLLLSSCAGTSFGERIEKSLQADPQLTPQSQATPAPETTPTARWEQLPAAFRDRVPRYRNGTLREVSKQGESLWLTDWQTPDVQAEVWQFYRDRFIKEEWKLKEESRDRITAQKDGWQAIVTFSPGASGTGYVVRLLQIDEADEETETAPAAFPFPTAAPKIPELPVPTTTKDLSARQFSDLDAAPEELQKYIEQLGELGVLASGEGGVANRAVPFKPNQDLSRRQYARWLFLANNAIHQNQPELKVRPAALQSKFVFEDVPADDPDFAAIQGLAEAGIIPSRLASEAAPARFQPDSPLRREELILWKVPLDIRKPLPAASVETVKDLWGFQDAAKIDPQSLRAVQADRANGGLSNIRRAFGYTTLFQPTKPTTRAEGAATLWYFGVQGEGLSAESILDGRKKRQRAVPSDESQSDPPQSDPPNKQQSDPQKPDERSDRKPDEPQPDDR